MWKKALLSLFLFCTFAKATIEELVFQLSTKKSYTTEERKSFFSDLEARLSNDKSYKLEINEFGRCFVNIPKGIYTLKFNKEDFKVDKEIIEIDGNPDIINVIPKETFEIRGKIKCAEGAFEIPLESIIPIVEISGEKFYGKVNPKGTYEVVFKAFGDDQPTLSFVTPDGITEKYRLRKIVENFDVWLSKQVIPTVKIAGQLKSNAPWLFRTPYLNSYLLFESKTRGLTNRWKERKIEIREGCFMDNVATAEYKVKLIITLDAGKYSETHVIPVNPSTIKPFSDTIINFEANIPRVAKNIEVEVKHMQLQAKLPIYTKRKSEVNWKIFGKIWLNETKDTVEYFKRGRNFAIEDQLVGPSPNATATLPEVPSGVYLLLIEGTEEYQVSGGDFKGEYWERVTGGKQVIILPNREKIVVEVYYPRTKR